MGLRIDERRRRARGGCVLATVLLAVVGPGSASSELTNNLCEAQVREIVAKRFGQQVARVEFRFRPYTSRGGYFRTSDALAYPEECPGYHYFEVHGDRYLCDGDVNQVSRAMVFYRSSGDGC